MMPITVLTPGLRDEAAMLCQIAASNPIFTEDYAAVAEEFDSSDAALDLALAAWSQVIDVVTAHRASRWEMHIFDAAAEALLRSGWTPDGWNR